MNAKCLLKPGSCARHGSHAFTVRQGGWTGPKMYVPQRYMGGRSKTANCITLSVCASRCYWRITFNIAPTVGSLPLFVMMLVDWYTCMMYLCRSGNADGNLVHSHGGN